MPHAGEFSRHRLLLCSTNGHVNDSLQVDPLTVVDRLLHVVGRMVDNRAAGVQQSTAIYHGAQSVAARAHSDCFLMLAVFVGWLGPGVVYIYSIGFVKMYQEAR